MPGKTNPHIAVELRMVGIERDHCLKALESLLPMLFLHRGERSLRHVLSEFESHYHQERPHRGKGKVILMPSVRKTQRGDDQVRSRERLGGLLKYYQLEAA